MLDDTNLQELSLQEVALRTKMAANTVRRWITTGQLPATKNGPQGRYRILVADLDRFIDRR